MNQCVFLAFVFAVGVCLQAGAAEKGKLGRAWDGLSQKSKDDREAKRKKAEDDQKQREAQKKLEADPQAYYEQSVKGKYAVWDGKPVPLVKLEGSVLDILDDKRILLSQEKTWYAREEGRTHVATKHSVALDPVVVVLTNTADVAKTSQFSADSLGQTGTYECAATGGVKRAAKQFQSLESISYDEFLKLREAGCKFPLPKQQ